MPIATSLCPDKVENHDDDAEDGDASANGDEDKGDYPLRKTGKSVNNSQMKLAHADANADFADDEKVKGTLHKKFKSYFCAKFAV